MKTILSGVDAYKKVWGNPTQKDTTYRLMKYLLYCEFEDKILLHNTVTGQLVELTNEEAQLIQRLPLKPTEHMSDLIANHFLVPEYFDEYKSVNQLRLIYQRRRPGNRINHFIILPTTFCNARCFYCYESGYPHVHMTEETAEKLIDYIDEQRKGSEVRISWFGGEPLVGMARIDQISQGLKDRQIPFTSTMVSNGYLFDENVVGKSKEIWNLRRVQITLDGTEDVYNRVKAYVNVKENPFRRVLRNIDLLSSNNIHVIIRLNVDFYNKDDIRTLIAELGEKYSHNDHVTVYQNMLFNNQGFEPVHHSQEDIIELSNIIGCNKERLIELNVSGEGQKIPSLEVSQCMADDPQAIMIQPDGSFCRCEHEDINDSYGNLDEGILEPEKLLKWKEISQRSSHCPDCEMYPACYLLRYCAGAETPCIESIREVQVSNIKEHLKEIYKKHLEGEKNEGI